MRQATIAVGLVLGFLVPLRSHETNFGISPSTLHKGGSLVEAEVEVEERSGRYRGSRRVHDPLRRRDRSTRAETAFHYGVTPDFTVGLRVPWKRMEEERAGIEGSSSGIGHPAFDAKYRFYKNDLFGGTNYASLIAAFAPGGPKTDRPPLEDGRDAWLAGLGFSAVRPVWSLWVNGAARFHEKEDSVRNGRETLFNAALGYRPWIAEKDQFELNGLLEFNYEAQERGRDRGGEIGSSGYDAIFLSPGIRINYNHHLVKLGVQIPVHQDWHGEQLGIRSRWKIGWEWMF